MKCALANSTSRSKVRSVTLSGDTNVFSNRYVVSPTVYNVLLPTTDKSRETQESPTVNHVDRPKQNKSTQPKQTGGPKDQSCHRCGGKHHPAHCTYKEYECHHCKRCGHLARVCRKVQEEGPGPAGAEQGRQKPERGLHCGRYWQRFFSQAWEDWLGWKQRYISTHHSSTDSALFHSHFETRWMRSYSVYSP